MKKIAVFLGGVLTVAVLGGGFFVFKGQGTAETAAYWDGRTELNLKAQDGSLPLVKAVKAKDGEAVESLLAKGADVDVVDKDGVSAVMAALESGQAVLFARLADVSKADFSKPEYLTKAIDVNSAEIVATLLKKGADVNAVLDFKGRKRPDDVLNYKDQRVLTPLKKAVNEDKVAVVAVLAQNGAEGVDDFLVEKLRTSTLEMVKALAENASDLRQLTAKGMDLLTYAAGEAKPEVVAYLLDKNVGDINKALTRVLSQRTISQPLDETVEMFVSAGATPSIDALELMLKRKNTAMFTKLAGCYANPNVTFPEAGEDVFMYAVRNELLDVAAFLLENGADVWKETKQGMTPIKLATSFAKMRPEILELLEKQITNVNDTGYDGETLLMLFAQSGDWENFQRIINKGGNIWQKDNLGKTVLMYAAEGGNLDILNHLVFKGDDLSVVDKHGRTSLMYAAAAGQVETVKYLADRGVEIASVDDDGKAALMYAAQKGYHEVVDMLINMGESAAIADNHGKTALMYAAEGGSLAALETLLMKGVDVNAVDVDDVPVLSYAVKGNNVDIVGRLLRAGANLFAVDKNGYMPRMFALLNGNEAIYDLLVSSRNQMSQQAKSDGKTIGIMAVLGGNVELMRRVLKEARSVLNVPDHEGRTFMMMLSGEGRPEIVRDGLALGGDIRLKDNQGRTPLMYAAEKSVGVNLIAILKASAQEVNETDNEGRTALMYALGYKENQPVKMHMLLTNRADAKLADKNGKTALMYAVANPYSSVSAKAIAEVLEAAKAVDRKDNKGRTALMYAVRNPNVSADGVQMLLNVGANVNFADNEGKTVLMYALEGGDMSKLRLLLAVGAKKDAQTKEGKKVVDFINPEMICFKRAALALLKD